VRKEIKMSYCKITKKWLPASEMQIAKDAYGDECLISKEVEIHTCTECGCEFFFSTESSKEFCTDDYDTCLCYECRRDYSRCNDCGQLTRDDDITEVDGNYVCEGCLSDNYALCEECDEWHSLRETFTINDKCVCYDCRRNHYTRCYHCEKWIRNDDVYRTEDDYPLCQSCYEDDTYTCINCGSSFYSEDSLIYNEDDCEYYCESCYDSQNGAINNYSYKPYPNFRRTAEDDFNPIEYFGFEIEVEGDRKYANEFLEEYGDTNKNDLYLKKDGSVDGFEIVTHPMTRNWFYEVFVPKMTRGMNFLRRKGFRGHNRCGIHIHVSTKAITHDMLSKMINLIFQKNKKHQELWLAITQRKHWAMKQWCSIEPDDLFSKKSLHETIKQYKKEKRDYKPMLGDKRYLAINTRNINTIEFRMFNSNTRPERIIKNAQVIFSLIDFTKTKIKVSMKNYLRFIEDHRKDYKELYDFLIEKHIYIPKLSLERLLELSAEDNNEVQKYIQSLSATQNLTVDESDNEGDIQCA
jgi:hypothetical protein